MPTVRLLLLLSLMPVHASCGESTSMPDDASVDLDGNGSGSGGLATTCTGACATTNLTAMFMTTRTLDRAYFGVNSDDNTLRVEAYKRAGTGCPTMTSPTPDYTLVIGRLPMPATTATLESPANILDFKGDLLGGPLGAAATMKVITPAAYAQGMMVALDVMLTFNEGTITGHLHGTYCSSLDQ